MKSHYYTLRVYETTSKAFNSKKWMFIFLFLTITCCVKSQESNIETIKIYYPEVYKSLNKWLSEVFADDPDKFRVQLELQANDFLIMAESGEKMDAEVSGNIIIKNSLPNEKDYNIRILEDLTIANPYHLLRCNWSAVKYDYFKLEYRKKKIVKEKPEESRWGLRLTIGGSRFTNLDRFLKKDEGYAQYALSFESAFAYGQWRNNIFVQADMGISYMSTDVDVTWLSSKPIEERGSTSLQQLYAITYIHAGAYKTIAPARRLFIGAGPFVGYNFYAKKEKVFPYPSSGDLKASNYGISAIGGIDWNDVQLSIRYSYGLNDMSKDNHNFHTLNFHINTIFWF